MPKLKVYTAKNLINNSRFVHFILEIKIPDIERICMRLEEIIAENSSLCTQENFIFISNAAVALTLYEYFRNKGLSKQEAYMAAAGPMWDYCGYETWRFYKKYKGKKAYNKLSKDIDQKIQGKYKTGWKIEVTGKSSEKLCFECSKCLYASFFEKYGIKDIGAMFCYADGIVYEQINGYLLSIEQSLILNDCPCKISYEKII